MNILLLVSGFLVLMAFGIFTMTKQSLSSVAKQHYFATHLDLERKAQNGVQKIAFRNAIKTEKTKTEKKESSSPKPTKQKTFSRDRVNPLEDSKLDISPLFQKPSPLLFDRLYEIAAADLYNLYANTEVGALAKKTLGEDFAYRMLDSLIDKGSQEKEDLSFEKLMPDETPLKEVYLKMVKGTKQYTLFSSKGYPPLGNFFLLTGDKKRKPFYFCFASTPLLKAVFGEVIAQDILQEEEGLGMPLKKQELQALLLKHPESKMQFADFQELMNLKRVPSAPASSYMLIDKESKISHKVRQPEGKGGSSS